MQMLDTLDNYAVMMGKRITLPLLRQLLKTTGNPMKNLAIFDLDNTLINTDSDHSWPQYLIKKGIVDAAETEAQNEKFYQDYQNGCLDIDAFLKFHLAPLARFSKEELAEFHREFMAEYIVPHISPMQRMLVQSHQMAGDEMLVISSTNEFIITPILPSFRYSQHYRHTA